MKIKYFYFRGIQIIKDNVIDEKFEEWFSSHY